LLSKTHEQLSQGPPISEALAFTLDLTAKLVLKHQWG